MTMATLEKPYPLFSWPPLIDKILAGAAVVMLGFVLLALARGHAHLAAQPWAILSHLATIIVALSLTPVMLIRPKGTTPHRALGYVWCSAMALTALISFSIKGINPGHFSPIHLLSLFTFAQIPLIIWSARTHRVKRHRRAVRMTVLGALLIAGAFTFPFNRLLGRWLFGG
jgi:uncharacterized membrane protein